MRTPELPDVPAVEQIAEEESAELPAFLNDKEQPVDADNDEKEGHAAAA